MASIKDLILSIESADSSFDEKLAAINKMEETLVAMRQQEEQAVQDNVDLIVEAIKLMEKKVTDQLEIAKSIVPEKGDKGDKGDRGADGKAGRDGLDGRDGKDGRDGVDGADGVSVTDAKIDFDGSLVITLSTGREINVGEVVAPDLAEKIKVITTMSTNGAVVIKDEGTTVSGGVKSINFVGASITATNSGDDVTVNVAGSVYDPTNVAITGGNINGTTIGGTTPAAGTFTTLTAQTERLNGTGSNLLSWSSDWTQGVSDFAVTITLASGIAPDSTNTANKFVGTNSTALHARTKSFSVAANVTSVFSIYLKKLDKQYIQLGLDDGNTNGAHVNIDLDAVAAVSTPITRGSGTGYSVSVTSLPSGWMRVALVGNPASTTGTLRVAVVQIDSSSAGWTASSVGNGTSGYYIWGAQLEINSAVSAYVATTSLPIYGTPSLSFSGVAGLGLQSDGSLYVSPAGTGALQAQATTSTTAGGNARGANAVDWQTFTRSSAAQVASGLASSVLGGARNTSNSVASTVVCGTDNTAGANNAFVGSGSSNTANGTSTAIVSGLNNAASGTFAFIGAGQSNTTAGFLNVVAGGQTNSGTSGSAVTTQSATMNGTTSVTLSGSNASIKVGQLITGTSITSASGSTPHTYVAAISGTSLTLSQAASGSSTSTLSFYTPHGVVVGGGNNQATGSYSFIGGGGDAGTAANRNVASGSWSSIVGGQKNTVSDNFSIIGGGYGNNITSTGQDCVIAGGNSNTISGSGVGQASISGGYGNTVSSPRANISGGLTNTANSQDSFVAAGSYGTTRSINGNKVFSAGYSPIATSSGVNQACLLVLARQTTDATATVLTSDINAAGTNNQVILPNNSAYYFRGTVVAGKTGAGDTKGWTIEGVIKRGANATSTTLVGTPTVVSAYADAGAATWTITATADTTNGGLAITVTGQASTTIRWVAKIETTEMTY